MIRAIDEEMNDLSIQYCSKEQLLNLMKTYIHLPIHDTKRQLLLSTLLNSLFDKQIYHQLIDLYRDNLLSADEIWKHSLYHLDDEAIQEYLELAFEKSPALREKIGVKFQSSLVSFDNHAELLGYLEPSSSSSTYVNDQSNIDYC